jgi:hypothetical protein
MDYDKLDEPEKVALMELVFNMAKAWKPNFIKYPEQKQFDEFIKEYVNLARSAAACM